MVTLERLIHREKECIAIKGGFNDEIHKLIRNDTASIYSKTHKCYYYRYEEATLQRLFKLFSLYGLVQISGWGEKKTEPRVEVPPLYKEMLTRMRYSEATAKNYISQFRLFLEFIHPATVEGFTCEHIHRYLLHLVEVKKCSISTQNIAINSIKFYLEVVKKGERMTYFIERPAKERKLPVVLSEDETAKLLQQVQNIKHRCLLLLLYSSGLRISELLNLQWADIDKERNVVHVRSGKGRKDRITLLSPHTYKALAMYLEIYKPRTWLFEGPGGKPYGKRSVNRIIERACGRAGISKHVSAHTLRHSFATHLLEHGTDIRYIQALLGHENSKTTERYAHVTKKGFERLASPLDRIMQSFTLDNNKDI